MRIAKQSSRRQKVKLRSDSFSLSNAKNHLGRLVEKACRGESVYIVRGKRRFIIQEIPPIDPIPMRPAGYFASCYSKEEIREMNRLAKAQFAERKGSVSDERRHLIARKIVEVLRFPIHRR